MSSISLAYSPCPNDTFIFNAIASGEIYLPDEYNSDIIVYMHDVETLNQCAFHSDFDVTKLSFGCWFLQKERYRLLEKGAAIGYGCGPILISSKPDIDIKKARIAIPGQFTTANMLFRLWSKNQGDAFCCRYDEIFDLMRSGRADCGVIIHESRFTFKEAGFYEIEDLGRWWEAKTGLPIPLGCIAASKKLPSSIIEEIDLLILESINQAKADPEKAMPYILEHAGELNRDVVKKHIDTFVNNFSMGIGKTGRAAIDMLEVKAKEAGIIP